MAAITLYLLSAATDATAAIGSVTEQTGLAEIQRDKNSIPSAVNTSVEMNDAVVTARARVGITFEDDTKVEINEQSKMVIDEFVYDPASGKDTGKLAIKVALGTARYASGQIAKDNPASVKIETPTATIGVRGTDFSMTVDELGRSLIILLPSCPVGFKNVERDCKTGKIIVTTDAGEEVLDQPFQATVTKSREANPAKSVILKLDPSQINNMLILTPPREAAANSSEHLMKTALDINYLDADLLKFDDLNINLLTAAGSRLDVDYLSQQFLANMLDLLNAELLENMLKIAADEGLLPGYKKASGLNYIIMGNQLVLYRSGTSSYAELTLDKDQNSLLSLSQDQYTLNQRVNGGGNSIIRISQSR